MRGWFRSTAGGLPATFWYLWAGTLVNRMGSFVIVFLAIYLTQERGFSPSAAGLVVGLYGAGSAAGNLVGGMLADRWGRRPTLLTAHLGAAALMLTLGLARGLPAIAVGALLLGMFAEGARPAYSAMMVDVVPERDRLRAFSLNYWALNLGFACAAVLAGFAAQADYLLLFVVDAATTLVTATIVFARVPESRPAAAPAAAQAYRARSALHTIAHDRVFLGFLVLNVLLALIFMQHLSMLPIAMGEDGLPAATYGWVIALNGVLIVAGQLFVPRVIRDRDRSRVLAVAGVLTGVGFGLTALADSAWFYGITVVVWTLGEMLASPSNATLMADLSPTALRGRYQGAWSLSWSVAAFAAPILGGYVREHAGDAALWWGCAAVGAVVTVGQLASGPARERRATALRQAPVPGRPPTAQPTRNAGVGQRTRTPPAA